MEAGYLTSNNEAQNYIGALKLHLEFTNYNNST